MSMLERVEHFRETIDGCHAYYCPRNKKNINNEIKIKNITYWYHLLFRNFPKPQYLTCLFFKLDTRLSASSGSKLGSD